MKNIELEEPRNMLEERALQRKAWIAFGRKLQPKLFITLKFRFDIPIGNQIESDQDLQRYFTTLRPENALEIANELLLRIHQRFFGRSKSEQLLGIGCLEYQASGMPHFHFLIGNDIKAERFKEMANKVILKARSHRKPLYLLDENSVDVRSVEDEEGAARYVTKLFKHWNNGEQMLLLNESILFA